ncbi:MAG: hypothetical protein LWW93_14605 [Hyphomicrobiales bacterium]|nr:hypothetical protein [Hyphomicrobiales bacterium]
MTTRPSLAFGVSLLFLATAAVPATAQSELATPSLSCVGPLAADSSHAKVVAAFGKENVVWTQVDGAEGEKIGATVLFPKDPKRRIELFWNDDKKRSGLSSARPGPKNLAAAPNGVRPGMTVAEVEKLNGKPFLLSGFGWDYGGSVTDWKGGALDKPAPGGCIVSVRFALPESADAVAAKVAGDQEFSSNDKNIRAARPSVESVALGWPQP